MIPETIPHEDTHRLRPFWGRVLVLPSTVDESQTTSGIVVPQTWEGDGNVKRGVILHVDAMRGEPVESGADVIPGTVVYYTGGKRVLDAVILERTEILAYEAD